ncbi:sigma-54-dependent transcriptional response regulator [Geotalea daltonii FRC-32]|uniref:Sigma-54-dependent transcriptional response regulator n=1 Tax=Geotalea daltonii (strain DSM 22248 / JCM 15807 / FRC-32) TaxID=316067 RepID=B9M5I1_GEODF|nr:sigma-54 dependent transcriptional regulator [Geotalea daltonii]ACM21740.1 sigma-54-dependent transcriptional response regulator [Geotalea daltonii FRC-32]
MANILIIDDDDLMCQSLSHVAKRWGHEVTCTHTLAAGQKQVSDHDFDVVFLDVRMPDGNGLMVLPLIQAASSAPEIIIMTGYGNPTGAELAINNGAWDYIEKGSSVKEITLSLVRALEYRKQKQNSNAARNVVMLKRDGIIGSSPRINACLEQVAQAAGSDAGILITGETGSGKELFARATHANSRRAEKPFVVVDCAALPDTLVESLLFGHERGAFTGAEQARPGLVAQADGGTLFLDEVGELPLTMQKAFLRVLQEHRFRPVGSQREVTSDFRLIAATNRNLDEMVDRGSFRQDLLYRLRTFAIELPPLRERREDLKILARGCVDRLCDRYSLGAKGFAPDFLRMLVSYPWPGNVRELFNAMERTVAAAGTEAILFPKHLPTHIRIHVTKATVGNGQPHAESPPRSMAPFPKYHDFRESIQVQAERQYFLDLLSLSQENIAEACRISGLSQSRLYALLKKLELPKNC